MEGDTITLCAKIKNIYSERSHDNTHFKIQYITDFFGFQHIKVASQNWNYDFRPVFKIGWIFFEFVI